MSGRENMGQSMQDIKKKGENAGKQEEEKMKGQAEQKGSDVAKSKGGDLKKKSGLWNCSMKRFVRSHFQGMAFNESTKYFLFY